MVDRMTLRIALKLSEQYAKDYAEYLDECEDYRRQGYRPHYCEHGTNNWTDYDNICGGCEDGYTMSDPMTRRTRALYQAKQNVKRYDEITAAWVAMKNANVGHLIDVDGIRKAMAEALFLGIPAHY